MENIVINENKRTPTPLSLNLLSIVWKDRGRSTHIWIDKSWLANKNEIWEARLENVLKKFFLICNHKFKNNRLHSKDNKRLAFLPRENVLTWIKEKKAKPSEFLFLFYLFFLWGEQPSKKKNDNIWHSLASDYTDTNIWGGAMRRSLSSPEAFLSQA